MRVLIVDDEPLARERIRGLLRREPDVTSIVECGDGEEAVAWVRAQKVDVVFLDVLMPGRDGFAVLEALRPGPLPLVIFVTAHARYALRAFDTHPVDYLCKPFDAARFASAVGHARTMLEATRRRRGPEADILIVKLRQRLLAVRKEQIDWIGAEGNYVCLHVGKMSYLVRQTITAVEQELEPSQFRRIHRGTIVNVERVVELSPSSGKDYKVRLRDGTELTLSRSHVGRMKEFLRRA